MIATSAVQLLALALVAAFGSAPASVGAHSDRRSLHSRSHGAGSALSRRATVAPTYEDWTSLGCVTEAASPKRALVGYVEQSVGNLTVAGCLNTCASMAYLYGGTQFGQECWCSDTLDTTSGGGVAASASFCNAPCSGDSATMCGGTSYLSLFQSTDTSCAVADPAPTSTSTSAPAASSISTALPSGWQSQGCVIDGSPRLLSGSYTSLKTTNTPAACIAACAAGGFSYAGTQNGDQCYCGSTLNASGKIGTTAADSYCQAAACPGDASQKCGGPFYMRLFKSSPVAAPTSSSAPIASSTSAAVPPGWQLKGCVVDGSPRLLTGSYASLRTTNTPAACIAACVAGGFTYAGLENGDQCYCGSKLNASGNVGSSAPDSACQAVACPGDGTQACGGSWLLRLFESTKAATASSSTSAPATSSTGTALPSGWQSQGCVGDGQARLLTGSYTSLRTTNTPAVCIAACAAGGFSYAGIQNGDQCYCGSTLNASGSVGASYADSACQAAACPGDAKQACGGPWRMRLFKSSTAPAPSTGTALPAGWQAQGCFTDGTPRLLSGSSPGLGSKNTPAACVAACVAAGFSYAGVEYGSECYCGSTLNVAGSVGSKVADSVCQAVVCPGDTKQTCGAGWYLQLYKSASAPGISSKSSSTSSRTSSTSSAAIATPTGQWTFSHCATDNPAAPEGGRALTGAGPLLAPAGSKGMTNVLCQSMCEARGFAMAGTEYRSECYCGNFLDNGNGRAAPASDCSEPCDGDASQKCGGGWRLSIYTSTKLKTWSLTRSHEGSTFFDGWDWYSDADPTHGFVDYLNWPEAFGTGLASVNSAGRAVMKVEGTPVVSDAGRQSIRISTSWRFNAGSILIMDATHMPVGCGTWPAWWTLGTSTYWPLSGEVDVLEGTHFGTNNLQSIHTGPGCSIPNNFGGSGDLVGANNCDSYATGNTGCGIDGSQPNNYGVPFNNNGGGAYAMLWTEAHIEIFFFPRNAIPADISAKAPKPDSGGWGQPVARWPATQCGPLSKYFQDHMGIFDTTFCGDWAANDWNSQGSQSASCAALTGYSTCQAYVKNRGADFGEAYWEINYVRLYN